MTHGELHAMVLDEAAKLKEHATAGQIANIRFPTGCMYEQMVHDSPVSVTSLLNLCGVSFTSRVNDLKGVDTTPETTIGWHCPADDPMEWAFSPIELYIKAGGQHTDRILDYLTGRSNTLNL